jgi:hypothetical protein
MKKLMIILLMTFLAGSLLGWVVETGTLEDFVYGTDENLEYDNWLSHVVERVASPNYNLYAPYDRQTTGFGSYTVPNTDQLYAFYSITELLNNQQYDLADNMLQSTGLPFTLVEFNDTVSGNIYWIIRENLNMNYIDDNGTPDWDGDDEVGSFDYGWGLYIFNPAAEYPVIITSPHNTDDFFTLPVSLKLFRETNAYALMASGVGREVLYNTSYGYYSNSFSLCDPTRQEDTVFNKVYQASCDYLRIIHDHRELSIQIHSYDWNRHLWYASNQISAGWGKNNPGIPIRDYSDYGMDIINQGDEWMLPANSVGIHPAVHLNDYYSVNCSNYPFMYSNQDTTFAVNTEVDLVGYRYNRQMVYTCSGWNDNLTYGPFFHIEMDELPNCYPQTEANYWWFYGYDPITERFDYDHLFDRALAFNTPWIEDLAAVIPAIFEYDDGEIPTSCSPLQIVSQNYDRVELSWEKTNCYDYKTYEILYSEEPVANGNYEIWDNSNDSNMNNSARTYTVITGLNQNTEYFFQMRVLDANDNYSELSNEVSCLTGTARLRYEKAVARDSTVHFSFNAYRQDQNAGFLIYRKAEHENEYFLRDSWQTNPNLIALNGVNNYTYNWTDTLVTNWVEYAYIAASTDSTGNEYWHNYPSRATPFDIYTLLFTHEGGEITDEIWFGSNPNASSGWDADYDIDQDESPSGDYVFAEFYEEDWDYHGSMIQQIEGGYDFDIELRSWVFRVTSNQSNDEITIQALGQFLRDGRKLYIIDQLSGQIVNLLEGDYTYLNSSGSWRYFTLYWGNILPDVVFTNPAGYIYQVGETASFSWNIARNYLLQNFNIYIVSPTESILIGENLPPFFNQINWTVPDGLLLEDARIVIDVLMIDGDRRQYTSGFTFGCVPSTFALAYPAGYRLAANPFMGISSIQELLDDADLYILQNGEYNQDIAYFYGRGYFLDSYFGSVNLVEAGIQSGNDQFNLQSGWNIVPNPHLTGIKRDDIIIITPALEMTFAEAVQYDLVESVIYNYDQGWHETDYVYPTEAFLLYCYSDELQVKFVPYNSNHNWLIREAYDLKVKLTASQNTGVADDLMLALNIAASDGYDKLYDLAEPCNTPGTDNLNFYTIMDSAMAELSKYNQDTKAVYDLFSERRDWNFGISCDQLMPVNISLSNSELPEDVVVIITIDGIEHDLSRQGDLMLEPDDHNIEGILSFVPVWMSEDHNDVISVIGLINYPNPFYYGNSRSQGIKVSFNLPSSEKVNLSVYNIKGQKVAELANDVFEAGKHSIDWYLTDTGNRSVASGVYFTRLDTGKIQKFSKLVIIK